MGITTRCVECGAESRGTAGLNHTNTCTATLMKPTIGYGMMPPATEIKFDTEKERKRFMKSIGTPGGFTVGSDLQLNGSDTKTKVTSKAQPKDTLNISTLSTRLGAILEVAHEVGENGHPLNTELLVSQILALLADTIEEARNGASEKPTPKEQVGGKQVDKRSELAVELHGLIQEFRHYQIQQYPEPYSYDLLGFDEWLEFDYRVTDLVSSNRNATTDTANPPKSADIRNNINKELQ